MKIRLSELRRIIREVLEEQAAVPGALVPGSSGPMSDKKIRSMGAGGLGVHEDELEEDEEFNEDTDF